MRRAARFVASGTNRVSRMRLATSTLANWCCLNEHLIPTCQSEYLFGSRHRLVGDRSHESQCRCVRRSDTSVHKTFTRRLCHAPRRRRNFHCCRSDTITFAITDPNPDPPNEVLRSAGLQLGPAAKVVGAIPGYDYYCLTKLTKPKLQFFMDSQHERCVTSSAGEEVTNPVIVTELHDNRLDPTNPIGVPSHQADLILAGSAPIAQRYPAVSFVNADRASSIRGRGAAVQRHAELVDLRVRVPVYERNADRECPDHHGTDGRARRESRVASALEQEPIDPADLGAVHRRFGG
jgi:hypothetical protein